MAFITWIHTGTYPAGGNPWNGQALSVDPTYRYFTPAQVPTAEELNFILGQITDGVNSLPETVAKNWNPAATFATALASGQTIADMSWDPTNSHWVVFGGDGSTNATIKYSDDGQTWTTLLTSSGHSWGWGAAHGTNSGVLVYDENAGDLWFVNSSAVATDTGFSAALPTGVAFWYPVASKIIGFSFATTHNAFSTPDGTTITDVTASLPGTWPGAGTVCTHFGVNAAGTEALVAATVTSGPTSHLLHVTNPGGVLTFTDLTIPVAFSSSTITGVAWNDGLQLWAVVSTSGGVSAMYTSPDLVTWTHHFMPAQGYGLAVLGNLWCTLSPDTYNNGTNLRALISADSDNWTWTASNVGGVVSGQPLDAWVRQGSDSLIGRSLSAAFTGKVQISLRL